MKRWLWVLLLMLPLPALAQQTWYVKATGGSRYSASQTGGQCDGLSNAAYPGSGTNQHCAFNDIRYLWATSTFVTVSGCPDWCWVISGGDTVIIDQANPCIQYTSPGVVNPGSSGPCTVGASGPNSGDGFLSLWGSPQASGAPPPPSGTLGQHTRILGSNYASCTNAAAKTKVYGTYGPGAVFALNGVNYVDVACLDVSDESSCGRVGQVNSCSTSYPLSNYAGSGISTDRTTTNTTITDVVIHGMAAEGMLGPTGDGVVLTRVGLSGNAGAGWNMDDGSGTTGTGNIHLNQFAVIFNGCAEVYPIPSTITIQGYSLNGGVIGQVADCADDGSGPPTGYGDGIGTATTVSSPAWHMFVDQSLAAYNTQDGFDLLHLQGGGSSLTITNSYAYGNEGQQIKIGAAGVGYNNVIVGNCNALRQSIPGLPAGYNSRLADFCRAGDTAAVMSVTDGVTSKWYFNTTYTAGAIALEVPVNGSCTTTCYLQYENNVMLGFTNNTTNGYPSGGSGNNPQPIYFDTIDPMGNSGSSYKYNSTNGQKVSIACPNVGEGETNAQCGSPGLTDQTFHLYGYGNMTPSSGGSSVVAHGITIGGITTDINGVTRANPPTIGAYEFGSLPAAPTNFKGTVILKGSVKLQ